jgi:hypothetical protein
MNSQSLQAWIEQNCTESSFMHLRHLSSPIETEKEIVYIAQTTVGNVKFNGDLFLVSELTNLFQVNCEIAVNIALLEPNENTSRDVVLIGIDGLKLAICVDSTESERTIEFELSFELTDRHTGRSFKTIPFAYQEMIQNLLIFVKDYKLKEPFGSSESKVAHFSFVPLTAVEA